MIGRARLAAEKAWGDSRSGLPCDPACRSTSLALWILIAIHAANDLTLQMGKLPSPLVDAAIDTILLMYGVALLRRSRIQEMAQPPVLNMRS